MILDKTDRKKSDVELKLEIDELKKMRNKDEAEIKILKVELQKLHQVFKKYKEAGGFRNPNSNIITLPERYIKALQKKADQNMNDGDQMQMNDPNLGQDDDDGIINTQQLLNDMNHVKN